jgi:hypothetical protein
VPEAGSLQVPIKKPSPKCIVVPIVLKMEDVDHQTLLEEWIASRATEGAEGEKLVEVNCKQFPKTFTSNLKGHNGTCWKRHMELMPDFAFIIFLPNIYCTISQLIATFCLFIPYFW